MPRPILKEVEELPLKSGSYFTSEKTNIEFIHTGCALLDMVLGGGYVLGRIANIVGDRSTGKTLLAMEAATNFLRQYPDGNVFYREAEAAFDEEYAGALGIPIDKINRDTDIFTVEDVFEDLSEQLKQCTKNDVPALYIIDSLDALSDRAELGRKIDEGSYGAAKAKLMSSLFRQRIQLIESSRMSVIVVSQVRDAIGVMFGNKDARSGGRALDFYATHIIKLAQREWIKKTKNKVERTIGVTIKARAEKNKIALPRRECQFDILFGYGIDNETSCLDWLTSVGEVTKEEALSTLNLFIKEPDSRAGITTSINNKVKNKWREIEESFLPDRRKY